MNPTFDFHALAPDLVLAATIVLALAAEMLAGERRSTIVPRIAAVGVLVAIIPIATLAVDGVDRSMFGGAYVVDNYALALKGFFLVAAWVTILMSIDYVQRGDYREGEFYFLLLVSVLGMSIMASSRDLITLFVALETISIPTYVLAGFRKYDRRSNEAAIKYYLIGVLSSAVMLYGMSIIFGITASTKLGDIADWASANDAPPLLTVAIFLAIVGFAFKVSAVPFHFWAPDTYEGAPTPVTAFLSVASKAGGFVAMLNIVFFGFYSAANSWWPVVWVLAAASMTLGNLAALRQTNIVRMLAYSSIAQGGFILVPFAAAGIAGGDIAAASDAFSAVVVYLLIYGAMNLGAFAVVIAIGKSEISDYAGLFRTSPGLSVVMAVFMASLAGIPPLAGWYAKFAMFRATLSAGGGWAVTLAAIAAVNSVIAFFYYSGVIRQMFFEEPATEAVGPVRVPPALTAALAVCTILTVAVGIYPQLFAQVGEYATRLT